VPEFVLVVIEVNGDQLEGSFLVRPLEEVCQDTPGSEDEDEDRFE